MPMPKLLIGMATFDDYRGVFFSVQALRLYNADAMSQVEIAIIDNNPDSKFGDMTKRFCLKADVAYVPFAQTRGTAAPRDHLFSVGKAPAVLCMDSHVLLHPGSVRRLIDFYEKHPNSRDLYHGPMIYDDMRGFSTHFDDVWGDDQMWGVWANMWVCPCGGCHLTPRKVGDRMETFGLSGQPQRACLECQYRVPESDWYGHELVLSKAGFRRLAVDLDEPPFEIPAMGLGLFTCRREAWQGFNPRFRGFGGEEWYIHEKFRKAGHKVFCLPFMRWLHEFREDGVKTPFPLHLWDKARNYSLGLTELDIPVDRAKQSFVGSGKIAEEDWNKLVENPDFSPHVRQTNPRCNNQANAGETLDELFETVKKMPRDLDKHANFIRGLAAKHETVTAFVKRCEWNVFLAAGRPKRLTIYQKEETDLLKKVHLAVRSENAEPPRHYTSIVGEGADSLMTENTDLLSDDEPFDETEIVETDLLVLDTVHSAERLTAELQRHAGKVRHRILVRGTGAFGETAEGSNAPGLFAAMRQFLQQHPDWFVLHHTNEQYGLTVLSRVADERPATPADPWPLGFGPGTELKKLIASLGINPSPNCTCNTTAMQMDHWGVDGCKTHREEIVKILRENAPRWGWKAKVKAAALAIVTGVAFKLDVADPYGSLVDLAIRKAAENWKEVA